MAYVETLKIGNYEFGNPGAVNTSTQDYAHRRDIGVQNRAFLSALFKTYPHLMSAYKGPVNDTKRPLSVVLAEGRKTMRARQADALMRSTPLGKGIIAAVADWFELTPADITGRSRMGYVVSARFVAIKLIYDIKTKDGHRKFSYPMIGEVMGKRDHSTIIHAVTTFEFRARAYPEMMEAYEELRDRAGA